MRNAILIASVLTVLTTPAFAADYPVSGRWGQSATSDKGPIDCGGLRVIAFNGNTRTDSNGGVPAYRLKSISAEGSSAYRVVDEFSTGQISNGSVSYTLRRVDANRIEMNLQQGGALKLARCK